MPDKGLLFVSVLCLVTASATILFPKTLQNMNDVLNRSVSSLDKQFMKHRYVFGILLFVVSYLFFRLALLLPSLRS